MSRTTFPSNFSPEISVPKNFVENIDPNVGVGVPIAVEEDGAGGFQEAVHLLHTVFEPADIMVDSARKTVFKTTYLAFVAPNHLVGAVAEKRRVEVNQVNGFGFQGAENFQVIAQKQLIEGHGRWGLAHGWAR